MFNIKTATPPYYKQHITSYAQLEKACLHNTKNTMHYCFKTLDKTRKHVILIIVKQTKGTQ